MQQVPNTAKTVKSGILRAGAAGLVSVLALAMLATGAAAETPQTADPTAGAVSAMEWIMGNLTTVIGLGATLAGSCLVAAKALGWRVETDTIMKGAFYLVVFGWVPFIVELLMSGFAASAG